MHDSSEAVDGSVSTLAMVKYMVPILKARGYAFVRLDEVPDIAALLPPLPCGSIKGCPGRRRLGRREHLDVASPRRLTTVDRLSSSGSGWRIAWAREHRGRRLSGRLEDEHRRALPAPCRRMRCTS